MERLLSIVLISRRSPRANTVIAASSLGVSPKQRQLLIAVAAAMASLVRNDGRRFLVLWAFVLALVENAISAGAWGINAAAVF